MPGADGADAEPDAQHHVEGGEREHALAAVEARLDGAHARRQRVRRAGAERGGAEPRDPERRREAEHRDHRADVGDTEAGAHQQVAVRQSLEHEQTHRRADAEQRDQHAEPGVRRVQHVVHEHDAEREQRAEPERDRERRGHHRAHQRDPERVEEAGVAVDVVVGRGVRLAELREPGDAEERHEERQRVDEEHQRERPVVDLERQRGHRREQRGADRDASVRRAEDEPVGERQLVVARPRGRGSTRRARGGRRCSRPRRGSPTGTPTTSARTSGTSAIITARVASIASIVRRRSQRTRGPRRERPPIAAGSSRSVRMPPTAIGELVSSSTSAMSATVPIQSPSDDTP